MAAGREPVTPVHDCPDFPHWFLAVLSQAFGIVTAMEEIRMKARNMVWIALLGLGLFAGGVAVGQDPGMWGRHPNLADAERHCHQAMDKISAAQQANDWDMGGHAARAKDLLAQADREIRAACFAADHH
jgi:hypothetical protein